ncbi:hypothetical protein HY642_05105 [Candidatus Woesearchaeota archaeon]|nr:hypothetical protein [Candidatus Woesearchaeota archaeon]
MKKSTLLFLILAVALLLAIAGCKPKKDEKQKVQAQQRGAEAQPEPQQPKPGCVASQANEFGVCEDGIDNDCDKKTDCGDDDCKTDKGCKEAAEGPTRVPGTGSETTNQTATQANQTQTTPTQNQTSPTNETNQTAT